MTEDILSFVLIPLQPQKKTQNVISPPQTGWMNACFPYTFQKLQKSSHFEEELKQKITQCFSDSDGQFKPFQEVAVTAYKMDQNGA